MKSLWLAALFCLAGALGGLQAQTIISVQGAEPSSANSQPWANGSLNLTINGLTKSVPYGQFSTPGSLASGLAVLFVEDPTGHLWARGYNDGTIKVLSRNGSGISFTGSSSAAYGPGNVFSISGTTVTTLSLSCSPTSVPAGTTTSCGITLTPGFSTTVYLYDGYNSNAIPLDSSGHGTIPNMLQGAPIGTYTLTVNYAGDAGHSASSASQTVTVYTPQTGNPAPPTGNVLYSYSITRADGTTSGYDAAGNILAYDDSVNGRWTAGYDSLNRITGAAQAKLNGSPTLPFSGASSQNFCWEYDSFGNRKAQVSSDQSIPSTGSCTPAVSSSANVQRLSYTASNRIDGYGFTYDDAGNVTGDGTVDYAYDAEGRVCASHKGVVGWTGYLYDAEGNRVAKGTLNPPANSNPCDFSTNGFVLTNEYILGPDGSAMTELDGQGNRVRTDVGADPGLLVSYDNRTLHLNVMDWLGTKRLQLSSGGVAETQYSGAPFGDQLLEKQLSANVGTTSPKYLTGKERDAESGLDYFGARYYHSNMGRWMSPDWADKPEAVPYSDLANPQSLNLYGYVKNNPLGKADPDGHCCDPFDAFNALITLSKIGGFLTNTFSSWARQGGAALADPTGRSQGIMAAGMIAESATPVPPMEQGGTPTSVRGSLSLASEESAVSTSAATASRSNPAIPESIPAGPSARPTNMQQTAINEMGVAHGCSTCGKETPGTKSGNWVGDHQPPTALRRPDESQVYKPQCIQCSRRQGGEVAAAARKARKLEETK